MLIEVTEHKHEGFICGTAEFNIKTLQQSFWETNITKQTRGTQQALGEVLN